MKLIHIKIHNEILKDLKINVINKRISFFFICLLILFCLLSFSFIKRSYANNIDSTNNIKSASPLTQKKIVALAKEYKVEQDALAPKKGTINIPAKGISNLEIKTPKGAFLMWIKNSYVRTILKNGKIHTKSVLRTYAPPWKDAQSKFFVYRLRKPTIDKNSLTHLQPLSNLTLNTKYKYNLRISINACLFDPVINKWVDPEKYKISKKTGKKTGLSQKYLLVKPGYTYTFAGTKAAKNKKITNLYVNSPYLKLRYRYHIYTIHPKDLIKYKRGKPARVLILGVGPWTTGQLIKQSYVLRHENKISNVNDIYLNNPATYLIK